MANYKERETQHMKIFGSILLVLISILSSYSQNKPVKIERNVSEYFVDTLYSQIDYKCSNISDSTLILWIEKENVDSLSDYKRIRKHFFTQKGDWSLIQIIWDGNVSSFVPELFDSFMKVVKPKEQFTFSIIKKGKVNGDLINSLEKHIVFVNAGDIKGIEIDNRIDMFNYKTNSVFVLIEWLK